jgi:hypothetical protein
MSKSYRFVDRLLHSRVVVGSRVRCETEDIQIENNHKTRNLIVRSNDIILHPWKRSVKRRLIALGWLLTE